MDEGEGTEIFGVLPAGRVDEDTFDRRAVGRGPAEGLPGGLGAFGEDGYLRLVIWAWLSPMATGV